MTQLSQFPEKQFLIEVLGPMVKTAAPDHFDDAVIVDLAELLDHPTAPLLVYSMDQPSFVKHPDSSLDPYRFYGRWVAAVTCNDITAMGARCRGFSLALAAPGNTDVDDIVSLVSGINEVLPYYGGVYEGGNFDCGDLSTVGFAWGLVPRHAVVRRSGAQVGDVIVVTGSMGLGWLEYLLRRHGKLTDVRPEDRAAFLHYKGMPVGAPEAIVAAAECGWFSSGMDLSDGLVEFLYTVATRNGLGCILDSAALPVPQQALRNLDLVLPLVPEAAPILERRPYLIGLDPGFDSPLLHGFTMNPADFPEARDLFAEHGAKLSVVGEVVAESGVFLRHESGRAAVPEFWDDQTRSADRVAAWVKFLQDLE